MDQRYWNTEILDKIPQKIHQQMRSIVCSKRSYQPGELVVTEGDTIRNVGIMDKGVLKSVVNTYDGKQQSASFFFKGDIFPLYLIYGGCTHYFFNAYCIKSTAISWIPVPEFKALAENNQDMIYYVLQYVAGYACYNKMIMRALHYRKVSERLAFWLLNFHVTGKPFTLPFSQEILADILYVNRSCLNQELRQLEKEHIISRSGREITILRAEALNNIL